MIKSYWAELDSFNNVVRVIVMEQQNSKQWLVENFGGTWIEASVGIGYTYHKSLDAFIRPKCHPEAVLNETTCDWDCSNAAHDVEV